MDRRSFLNTILVSPVVTSVLLATQKSRKNSELYLIADNPQDVIPAILNELSAYNIDLGQQFSFLTPHPHQAALSQALQRQGHILSSDPKEADLTVSFSLLQNSAQPSFTLIKSGQIWDVRTQNLRNLWMSLQNQTSPSSGLTIVGFAQSKTALARGRAVTLFRNGSQIAQIPLAGRKTEVLPAHLGNITLNIDHGRAWISESSCRHQICRLSPPVSLTGERIICVPNHFLLEVQGPGSVDTVIG